MAESNNNPVAGYIEAQMAGTAGIVQAAMQGMQRVTEILLRGLREGAGSQFALARSMAQARDVSGLSRLGEAQAGPGTEQFSRYQQELIGAVTAMNQEVIQASYSMMERIGQTLAASAAAMGTPAGRGDPLDAYQEGVRQWQGAMEQLRQAVGAGTSQDEEADEDETEEMAEPEERPARKAANKRSGRR